MKSFYTDVITKNPFFRRPDRVSTTSLLEYGTLERVQAILQEAERRGERFMVYETYRSKERQALLYERGASKLREVGVHHYGLACDLVKDVGGEPSWKGSFALLGELAKEHGLVWGGSWKTFRDLVHVQRCEVGQQRGLFAGTWYPEP